MQSDSFATQVLSEIAEAFGPTGREQAVRDLVLKKIRGLADEVKIDKLGNLVARKNGRTRDARTVMLVARLDEPGVMANHIDLDGMVRFTIIGALSHGYLPGARVRFEGGAEGIVRLDSGRSSAGEQTIAQMFIDVGVSSRGDCPVSMGEIGVVDGHRLRAGSRLAGRGVATRAAAAVLVSVLQRAAQPRDHLYFVFTVRNHPDAMGAQSAAYAIEPDIAVELEAVLAPQGQAARGGRRALGKGPLILLRDQGGMADPVVVQWLETAGARARIVAPRSAEVAPSGTLSRIQRAGRGVAAAGLGIPCLEMNSPSEIIDVTDLERCARLVGMLVRTPVPRTPAAGRLTPTPRSSK